MLAAKQFVQRDQRATRSLTVVHSVQVHSILRHTAELLGLTTDAEFEELYEKTAWFYDEKFKRRGAAFDVFLRAVR